MRHSDTVLMPIYTKQLKLSWSYFLVLVDALRNSRPHSKMHEKAHCWCSFVLFDAFTINETIATTKNHEKHKTHEGEGGSEETNIRHYDTVLKPISTMSREPGLWGACNNVRQSTKTKPYQLRKRKTRQEKYQNNDLGGERNIKHYDTLMKSFATNPWGWRSPDIVLPKAKNHEEL